MFGLKSFLFCSAAVFLWLPSSTAFSVPKPARGSELTSLSRREALAGLVMGTAATTAAVLVGRPSEALADVWSGNELPKGAAQFNNVIRLRSNLRKVKRRVLENGSDMDKQEWEGVGQFLRGAYATGDDMKDIAAGIKSAENKARALEDIVQLRKYAQAGDVPVSKLDKTGFIAVADKMEALVNDYFDALTDVPDEI